MLEALPPSLSDEELIELFTVRPEFEAEQRTWSATDRLQMIGTLPRVLVPLRRHVELGKALDTMLRNGYVGRLPQTPAHARRNQAIYEAQKAGTQKRSSMSDLRSQLSALLMGLSGMGKSTVVKRWLTQFPEVIFHKATNTYQVLWLHIEMPSDGSSIKGLAHAILHRLDELVPGANYFEDYASGSRNSADSLMRSVAHVMNAHFVGFVVADEIQNLANAHKAKQTVMTELVSACNELGVPILFIGTNKAGKVFSLDFRQSRRASGHGISAWDRLHHEADEFGVNEWMGFLSAIWNYQWVNRPVELDAQYVELLYHYSAGVIDIAVKLFAAAQARAILDGSEQLTPELLANIYESEFKILHPMLDALRRNDYERLAQYEDIAPIGLDEILESVARSLKAKTSDAYRVKPTDPTFAVRVAASLVASGFGEEEATSVAREVEAEGKARNLSEATTVAHAKLKAVKPVPRAKAKRGEPDPPVESFEDRPADYRRAIQAARLAGTGIYEQLQGLGMARPFEELVALD
jgi:AAA domain